MRILFINIKELVQIRDTNVSLVSGLEMGTLPTLKNAYLYIVNDYISDYGSMETMPQLSSDQIIDAHDRFILPAWCDSHTHLVYAGNREQEFVDRINGLSYEEIAHRGGGILNSTKKLQTTPEEDLYHESKIRLEEIMSQGTGAVEIKSGYGLTVASELKILRVIKRLKENYPITIKATFLGAHAFPLEYKNNHKGYIDLIINEMLPEIVKENLADYIDAFCETGYFSVAETEKNHGSRKKI